MFDNSYRAQEARCLMHISDELDSAGAVEVLTMCFRTGERIVDVVREEQELSLAVCHEASVVCEEHYLGGDNYNRDWVLFILTGDNQYHPDAAGSELYDRPYGW